MRMARLRGLRGRLAVGTLALLIAGLAVADFTAFVSLRNQLAGRNEAFLQLSIQRGITLAQTPGIDWTSARLDRILPANTYFAIYDSAGGLLIERLPTSAGPLPPIPSITALPQGTSVLTNPGQRDGLVVRPRSLPPEQWSPITVNGAAHEFGGVVAGVTNADDVATVKSLVIVQLWSAALIIVVALGGTWLILWFGLRPLRDVAETAHEISSGDRSRRVPVTDPGTEIGAVSTALNDAFDHVDQSEQRMRTFVADASHELRTPLATIHGWADLYLHGGMREWDDVDRAMTRIRLESARMNDLVEQLLALARLDVQPPATLADVDLTALCADVIANLQVTAPTHELTLIGGGAPPFLGDEGSLRQAVVNLVSNSIRHTPDGTAIAVTVAAEPDNAAILLVVHDDGPGMSTEQLEHAFERFWRANPGRGPSGGTGLGLAIVRAIALAHGGTVSLDSAPGEGFTVTMRLPRRE